MKRKTDFGSITYDDLKGLRENLKVSKLIALVGITRDTGLPFVKFSDGTAEVDTALAREQARKWFGLTLGMKDDLRLEPRDG